MKENKFGCKGHRYFCTALNKIYFFTITINK